MFIFVSVVVDLNMIIICICWGYVLVGWRIVVVIKFFVMSSVMMCNLCIKGLVRELCKRLVVDMFYMIRVNVYIVIMGWCRKRMICECFFVCSYLWILWFLLVWLVIFFNVK